MKIFNKKSEEEKVEEEIISMVNEGNEQGLIEDSEAQFITNIFEFTDKESRDVMTARLNVMAIDKNSDLDEVMEIMIENNYSRYPVYDGDLDNIVGIIYFKDFVKEYLRDKTKSLAEIMVEATFVHPTYNIAKLFRRMQTAKIHMVIVVDEYGQTEGIVTMEDILEEIVGNILDEYDDASEDIKKRGDMYIVSGKAELDVAPPTAIHLKLSPNTSSAACLSVSSGYFLWSICTFLISVSHIIGTALIVVGLNVARLLPILLISPLRHTVMPSSRGLK